METSPWWFTPLMTFAGIVFGGAVSIITAWLTQRYSLQAQLAIKRLEAEATTKSALLSEKRQRYMAIVQKVEGLYGSSLNPSDKAEFLRVVREVGLLGDQELVRKLRHFMADLAGQDQASHHERLFGDAMLEMRKGLGLPSDDLNNEDFRFIDSGVRNSTSRK